MDVITVTRLMQVRKEVPLGERRVMAQALSSADLRAQTMAASLAGLRMKQSLADPASETYQALVGSALAFASHEQLIEWCAGFKLNDLQREAYERHQPVLIPFPDDATEDERMNTLAQREQAAEQLAKVRAEFIEQGLKAYQEQLQAMAPAELEPIYLKQRIDSLINGAWREARENSELLFGVRGLDGEPYFENLEEVGRLPESVRQYLLAEVRTVNDIDPLTWSSPLLTASPEAPGS